MGGKYLSTVGVDVSEWTYCKKKSKYGKVTFSTWDFGGQVSNGSVSYLQFCGCRGVGNLSVL